jgi:glyoxalase family protein
MRLATLYWNDRLSYGSVTRDVVHYAKAERHAKERKCDMRLNGLHHVTAITANAKGNLAFYTQTLGLRLVKKTVNQDDVTAYHLFYADANGSAGTEVTFFDWAHIGAHTPGAGDISSIALRVPGNGSLEWWQQHLDEAGIKSAEIDDSAGRRGFSFTDFEGQRLQLVEDGGVAGDGNGGAPWDRSTVPTAHFIRGLDAVTLTVRRLAPTEKVLLEVLGMRWEREYNLDGRKTIVYAMAEGGAGNEVHVVERPELNRTMQGAGGVHHVAFRVPNVAEQSEWMQQIRGAGLPTSDLIDRFYFNSLYFREPNGILFEIATDGPGFATDESAEHMGEGLALPPFLEPRRAQIEAGLRPLV